MTAMRAPHECNLRMLGRLSTMRVESATRPSFVGTFKSARTNTRFPLTSASEYVRSFIANHLQAFIRS